MGGPSKKLATARRRPRRCVGCGREEPKTGLIRVVRSPNGAVSVDPTSHAPGRGAYLCVNVECVRAAMKKNSLSRALKLSVDPVLYASIEALAIERNGPAD